MKNARYAKLEKKITARVKELTPSTLSSLLMRLYLSSGSGDIEIRGKSLNKEESFKAYVKDGKLTRFVFISKSKVIDFEMNVDLRDLEKERDVFKDVPISGAFKVTVSPFKF